MNILLLSNGYTGVKGFIFDFFLERMDEIYARLLQ